MGQAAPSKEWADHSLILSVRRSKASGFCYEDYSLRLNGQATVFHVLMNVHGHPRAKFNSTALFKKTKHLHEIRDIVIFKLTKGGLGCASIVRQLMSLFEALDCSAVLCCKKGDEDSGGSGN